MFRDREDAARQLAEKLKERELHNPLVLAIPRGGVVTGAVLARELGADLDVVMSRKLRAPGKTDQAVGALAEDGQVYLNDEIPDIVDRMVDYLADTRCHHLAEMVQRTMLFRGIEPQAPVVGRSVIVTDDGIVTGSTMIGALQAVTIKKPRARRRRARRLRQSTGGDPPLVGADVVCLLAPEDFQAIGQVYEDFTPVNDAEVAQILRQFCDTARLR